MWAKIILHIFMQYYLLNHFYLNIWIPAGGHTATGFVLFRTIEVHSPLETTIEKG